MNVTLSLPDEMAEQLMQIARTNQVSVDELASAVLAGYIDEQATDDGVDYELTPEELTELKASFEQGEAEFKAGKYYTQHDMDLLLETTIQNYIASHKTNNGHS